MPIDLSKLHERAKRIKPAESAATPPPADTGAAERRNLQAARSALNAEGAPPGQEPQGDPIVEANALGMQAGGRGSDRAMEAYVSRVFGAAEAGDPRVVSQGTVSQEQREQWIAQAQERQTRNRDNSGFTQR